MTPPARAPRGEGQGQATAALRQLKARQPELAGAVDLQIALLDVQRRVQARVQLPAIDLDKARLDRQQQAGQPLLRFADIPLDWTELGLMLRKTSEILHRFDALDEAGYERIAGLAREPVALRALVRDWYDAAAVRERPAVPPTDPPAARTEMLDEVILLAMRPFLTRCMQALLAQIDLSGWSHGYCPLCGGEPEFGLITPAAERVLICVRCTARWRFAAFDCPFCGNHDPARIRSFTSGDGRHRLYACDGCRRYLKALDARFADSPLIVSVDQVATMALDAAAMQKGYRAEGGT